jgi:hypothetical protein
MKKYFLLLIISIFFTTICFAQTTLSAGDIVIVGMNCDDPDEFAFAPLVDLEAGTEIIFTDCGWLNTGTFRSGEGALKYTAPSSIAWGNVVIYTGGSAGAEWSTYTGTIITGGTFSLSASGDQILAFQGSDASPTFLYALNNDGAGVWQADATNTNTSALPNPLTNALNAVALNELDNYAYTGGPNSNAATLRSMVSNNTNWTGSEDNRQSMPASPLPVELTAFTVSVNGKQINLKWTTKTEVNNYGFEIERSLTQTLSQGEGLNKWEKIGFVAGAGNSNSPKYYNFVDDKTNEYGKYNYRLKQLDNDGKFEYSSIVEVDLGAVKEYVLNQNYPNPFNPSTVIKYAIPKAVNVKLSVYNILGSEIAILVDEYQEAGAYTKEFSVDNIGMKLTNGVYFYKLEAGNFIDTKKFILMK